MPILPHPLVGKLRLYRVCKCGSSSETVLTAATLVLRITFMLSCRTNTFKSTSNYSLRVIIHMFAWKASITECKPVRFETVRFLKASFLHWT